MKDHPNYTNIEKERSDIFAELVKAQEARKGAKAFLQCLATPELLPDGSSAQAFTKTRKVGDEVEDWTAMEVGSGFAGLVTSGTLAQYYVHRYDGPSGVGYILGCRADYKSQVWLFEEHHGLEERDGIFGEWCQLEGGEK